MSTTSRPSKLDIRLRNPTSTQRQWLQDTDLLAVRILYALRTSRRDFEGGGGSGTGAMAGRTRRHQPGIHDHGATATAVSAYTEACELEEVVRGIFGAALLLLVQLNASEPPKTAARFTKNGLHEKQAICSQCRDSSARKILARPQTRSETPRPNIRQRLDIQEAPLRRVRPFPHDPRAALHPKPHNQRSEHVTDTSGQAPRAASPSGKKSLRATSPTQTPRTTAARRNACPCLRTTTSACTTRRRYVQTDLPTTPSLAETTFPSQVLTQKTGCPHARPPSRIPQGRGKHQARRRALGRRDTETGRAGRPAGGEEPQAVQVVPAQGDQLDRQCEGGADESYCVYQIKRT